MTDLLDVSVPPERDLGVVYDLAVVHDLARVRRPAPASASPRARRLARLADRQAEDVSRSARAQALERRGRCGR